MFALESHTEMVERLIGAKTTFPLGSAAQPLHFSPPSKFPTSSHVFSLVSKTKMDGPLQGAKSTFPLGSCGRELGHAAGHLVHDERQLRGGHSLAAPPEPPVKRAAGQVLEHHQHWPARFQRHRKQLHKVRVP